MWWRTLLGILAGILLVYAVLLGLLWGYARRHPDTVTVRDALRLLPDLLRLVRRLAADRAVPTAVRVRLVLLLVYLASPVDLVPDLTASSATPMTRSSWPWCCARSPAAPARRRWPGTGRAHRRAWP